MAHCIDTGLSATPQRSSIANPELAPGKYRIQKTANPLKAAFESVRLLRPESVRKQSREIYFVAKGLKTPAAGSTP